MTKTTKKCPYCAEEILAKAKKCKHCGESLIKKETGNAGKAFGRYEEWLKQNYPAYQIVSQNTENNFLVLNKEYKPFNALLFIILIFLGMFPGLIYALVTLTSKKIISLTVYFDKNGRAISIDNNAFAFLMDKYNASQGFEKVKSTQKPKIKSFHLNK